MSMTETPTTTVVDAATLRDAATICCRVANNDASITTRHVCFDGTKLAATDLATTVVILLGAEPCPAMVLPAKLLRDAAKGAKPTKRAPQTVALSASGLEDATIVGRNGVVTMRTLPASDWPLLSEAAEYEPVPLSVLDAMGNVAWAVSTDKSRPILCTVAWTGSVVAANDSFRCHSVDIDHTAETEMMVPAAALKLLGQCAAKFGEPLHAHRDDTHLTVNAKRWTVTVRLTEGSYPNFQGIYATALGLLDTEPVTSVTFPEGSATWLRDSAKQVGKAVPVRIVQYGDVWRMTLSEADGPTLTGPAVQVTGADDPGAFNPRFLADMLDHDGPTIVGTGALKPWFGTDREVLLMTCRVA